MIIKLTTKLSLKEIGAALLGAAFLLHRIAD